MSAGSQPLVKISATFPGESLAVAILEYAKTCRETMSQENRDKLDGLMVRSMERWADFWEGRL
jgi:hypothetical protein